MTTTYVIIADSSQAKLFEYDQHLILIAPPQFLGNLRKELTTDCARLVTMELNKNLVNERAEVIIARLQDQDNDAAAD